MLIVLVVSIFFCSCDMKNVKIIKSSISTEVLDKTLSNCKYRSDPFSISVGKLVNYAVDDYKIKWFHGQEVIDKGYVSENDIPQTADVDNLYFAIISGEAMINPEIPYMREHEEEAVKAWLLFDNNQNLIDSGIKLCGNLETCAIIIMTR